MLTGGSLFIRHKIDDQWSVWYGDLDLDVNRGPLAGEVSGTYEDHAIHFFGVSANWKL